MSVTITITKTGFENIFDQDWDDPTVDRFIEWAKVQYANDDGTLPGQGAACNRASKAVVQAWRDAIRNKEYTDEVKAVPPPADIPVDAS